MRKALISAAIAVPVTIVLATAGLYGYEEVAHPDRVGHNVTAAGHDLSGLSREDAVAVIAAYEDELVAAPAPFIVNGEDVVLKPATVGLAVDEEAVVDDALEQRRAGGFWSDLVGWVRSRFTPVDVPVPTTVDDGKLEAVLSEWDRRVVDHPAYEGDVLIESGAAVPEYPRPGALIDRSESPGLITRSLSTLERLPVALPLTELAPTITDDDIDAGVALANDYIDHPVKLWLEGFVERMTFTTEELASAVRTEVTNGDHPEVRVWMDEDRLRTLTELDANRFTIPAVDATFDFDKETHEITINPSRQGYVVDVDAAPQVIVDAALESGSARMPTKPGDTPALTTEQAEAMRPFGEVSTFTTYHPCCKSRVKNIHLLADAIDGSIVMPGEVFSINETAGKRTRAKGYVAAGAIINGEVKCCDSPINIGGGTSQFATTFYNAVFFGCYEDVEHKPHSLYFSRYPYVREATLGFPWPDVKFRNDSDAPVFIDTSYTGTSITVTFYGNNGGRTCEATRSGNTVTRVMTHPDGTVTRQSWTWTYKPKKHDG